MDSKLKLFGIFLFLLFFCHLNSTNYIIVDNNNNDREAQELYYTNDIETPLTNEFFIRKLSSDEVGQVLKESVYAHSFDKKSHRFYFTVGERQEGDIIVAQTAKQMGWKYPTNTTIQIDYPGDKKEGNELTFVFVIVYQASAENRIHISKGGVHEKSIEVEISANSTNYLQYNATFFGLEKMTDG